MNDRLRPSLERLDRIEAFLESTPLIVPEMHWQQQKYLDAAWDRHYRLVRGYRILMDVPLRSEASILGRSLVELAITVAWVGSDLGRFERWWRQGARERKKWTDGIAMMRSEVLGDPNFVAHRDVIHDAVNDEPVEFKQLPGLKQRSNDPHEKSLLNRTRELYESSYRYLCNDAHLGLVSQLLILHEDSDHHWFDAEQVVLASKTVLEVLNRALSMEVVVALAAEV